MSRCIRIAAPALLALAPLAACDSVSDLLSVDPSQVVRVEVTPASLPADGASRATVTARIPPATAAGDREVRFVTTGGMFQTASGPEDEVEVLADTSGLATATLIAPAAPGTATVQAITDDDFAASRTVTFTRAYPDRIDIDPGTLALSATAFSTTTIVANLRRSTGVASEGTAVSFSAVDGSGRPIGTFQAVTPADDEGRATAVFGVGDVAYRGPVRIVARVDDPGTGQSTVGQATLTIVD